MKTFFKKYEYSGVAPLRFLGLFSVSNNHKSKPHNKHVLGDDKGFKIEFPEGYLDRFPIYDHFKLDYEILNHPNDHLYLGFNLENNEIIKDLEEYPTLFLEFADLDLRNTEHIYNFVLKYGTLSHPFPQDAEFLEAINSETSGYKETSNRELKKQFLLKGNNLSSKTEISARIWYESFETWIRLQTLLRTLIKLWRYLKNVKIKRFSPATGRPYYEDELFTFLNNEIIFCDVISQLSVSNLNHDIEKFYFDQKYLDKENFTDLNTNYLKSSINLTKDYENYKLEQYIEKDKPDFLQYFSEEFINEQLNKYMSQFSPKLNRYTNVSFIKDVTKTNINNQTRMICDNLQDAIIYQFLETITNDKEFIRCLECQKWMNTGRKKSERKNYCSNQCRAKAYDRRKKLSESNEVINVVTSLKQIMDIKDDIIPKIKKLQENKTNEGIFDIFSDIFAPNLNHTDKILFNNILKNCFDNFSVETQQISICDHLGITVDQSKNLMRHIHITTSGLMRFNFSPYWDWDYS